MSSGRRSNAQMKPLQASREQQIAAMVVTGGMTNDQIWSSFEAMMPHIIKPDDPRRIAKLITAQYDAEERAKLGRAIRSVRGLMQKARMETDELLEILGEGETRSATKVDYENIRRIPSGDPIMDANHGITHFRWLLPAELKGKTNPDTGKDWTYGDLIPKKMLKYMNPQTGVYEPDYVKTDLAYGVAFGDKTGYTEVGFPVGFVAAWGGAKGTGKSRLAIEVERSMCGMYQDRAVLHNYGESNMPQLRQWIGPKAPENFIIGERKTLSQIISDIYKYKPILFVQDSLQTIVECDTSRGLKEVLATFKQLATEEAAGKPHIICISQLNKKGDLKGSSDLGHLVDIVVRVFRKVMGRRSEFRWETEKNRGGETPLGADYKHTEDGVVCLGTGSKSDRFNLVQQTSSAVAQGITDPT